MISPRANALAQRGKSRHREGFEGSGCRFHYRCPRYTTRHADSSTDDARHLGGSRTRKRLAPRLFPAVLVSLGSSFHHQSQQLALNLNQRRQVAFPLRQCLLYLLALSDVSTMPS